MEVREPDARYLAAVQRTELGEFPADWKVVPLGEFEPFITSGSRGWAAYYADIGSTFLRITNLSRSCIYPSLKDLRYVAVPPDNSEGVRTALRAGDILISITADIGIVGLVTEAVELPAYINQHIALVRFDRLDVNSRYVAYLLAGAAAQRRFKSMTDAGAKAGMNLAGVRDVLAALPPSTDEQAAIADALTDADALIDSLEQLLTKKRQIKQGAMQELFTGKRRLPGFSGEWTAMLIGEQVDLLTGFPFASAQYSSSGVRLLRGSNVKRGKTDWSDDLVQNWPKVTPEIAKYELQVGDLVIAMDGSLVGRSYARLEASDIPALLLQRVARIRSKTLEIGFLCQLIGSDQFIKYCDSVKTVTAIPHISSSDITRYSIRIPPSLEEQSAIATVLSDMDSDISSLESRLTKARALKQAMAQALLTGRIRIPLGRQEPAAPAPPPEGLGELGSGPARTQEPTA